MNKETKLLYLMVETVKQIESSFYGVLWRGILLAVLGVLFSLFGALVVDVNSKQYLIFIFLAGMNTFMLVTFSAPKKGFTIYNAKYLEEDSITDDYSLKNTIFEETKKTHDKAIELLEDATVSLWIGLVVFVLTVLAVIVWVF